MRRRSRSAGGARDLARADFDALRIEDGRPLYRRPTSPRTTCSTRPASLREYHSATKGCYVGQEVVARLEARGGNVNKLLRGLRLDGAARGRRRDQAAGQRGGHA